MINSLIGKIKKGIIPNFGEEKEIYLFVKDDETVSHTS